ncbi:MAG TPA: sigma-70 family RNA polymerase sigma factor [Urbifossiella sp.]|nr:sigma-70 family RNA polymerase sigma factor [Urbifossiella sp.]
METDREALTDGQLLDRFIADRDGDALGALVRRHAPMVWGVCRRALHNPHDAEDAVQATFLVLVRRAASVSPRGMVGNWLYGVALRTANKAAAIAARRRVREQQMTDFPEPADEDLALWEDVRPVLDRELGRLPDRYRAAVVLCDLEGLTRQEAARQLGLPEGTVASRLVRGRALLARRLMRYNLFVAAGSLAAAMARGVASAAPPPGLAEAAVTAGITGAVPPPVAALTEGVLRAMFISKLKTVAVLGLAGLALLAGAGFLAVLAVQEPARPDKERIRGTWTVEAVTDGGRERNPENPKMVITAEKLTIKSGDRVEAEGTYELDPTKTPRWIDITGKDRKVLGIYRLDGDKLTICLNEHADGDRPTKFASESGSPNDLLIVLRRDK